MPARSGAFLFGSLLSSGLSAATISAHLATDQVLSLRFERLSFGGGLLIGDRASIAGTHSTTFTLSLARVCTARPTARALFYALGDIFKRVATQIIIVTLHRQVAQRHHAD